MMKYVKPDLYVEEFALNESIALCNPEEVTGSIQVHCLKTNKHEIFESQCGTKYTEVKDSMVTYKGIQYLVWGQGVGKDIKCGDGCDDCNANESLFNEIVKNTSAESMDHIAPVTQELKYLINSSQ